MHMMIFPFFLENKMMKTFLCVFLQTGVIFSIAANEKIDSVVDQFNAKSVIDLVAEQYVFNDHNSVVFNDPDSAYC